MVNQCRLLKLLKWRVGTPATARAAVGVPTNRLSKRHWMVNRCKFQQILFPYFNAPALS